MLQQFEYDHFVDQKVLGLYTPVNCRKKYVVDGRVAVHT
jgi:hypothetical protein